MSRKTAYKEVRLRLIESTGGRVVAERVELADHFISRLAGLQFRKKLAPGHGLLLVPCGSIHMFFMRFPIDAVMIAKDGSITAVRRGVAPWRLAGAPAGTHAVLELGAGEASSLEPGMRLEAVPAGEEKLAESVLFLVRRP